MFHLSLPVRQLEECVRFYRDCFSAEVRMLSSGSCNLFVFGGQVTFHDRAVSGFTDQVRREMHFGQVVTIDEWAQLRHRIMESGYSPIRLVMPGDAPDGRGKLLIADPSGNLVEINSEPLAD
jgi:extradiol dioxygenase family protein